MQLESSLALSMQEFQVKNDHLPDIHSLILRCGMFVDGAGERGTSLYRLANISEENSRK